MHIRKCSRLVAAMVLAVLAASVMPTAATAVPTFNTLFSFCNDPNFGCENTGSTPQAALLRDAQGNLFGTAEVGNDNGHGTAYELIFDPAQQTYSFKLIYRFCQKTLGNLCLDGLQPASNLIMDVNGNLYGTTTQGGKNNQGIIFELVHHNQHNYALKVLHAFCNRVNCKDGADPAAGLTYQGEEAGALYDGSASLYGTTLHGGTANNAGVAYRFTPGGGPAYQVIRNFCWVQNSCSGGAFPLGLTIDANGLLYGIAEEGGRHGQGVLFRLSPHGNRYSETILYAFCRRAGCTDGREPSGPVSIDAAGNIFGTTTRGGKNDSGVVFELNTVRHETVLYSFCKTQPNCGDGSGPSGNIVVASNGDIFGTTEQGGNSASCCGVLFRIRAGKETVLHTFCPNPGLNCDPDGEFPFGGLITDGSGNLYGTTLNGGQAETFAGGTVFQLTP